jgi:hypothetical protein
VRKRLRELGGADELDQCAGVLIATLTAAAHLADACCAPDSDVPVYARVKALQLVGDLEGRLHERIGQPESDAYAEFLKEMSTPVDGNGEPGRPAGW